MMPSVRRGRSRPKAYITRRRRCSMVLLRALPRNGRPRRGRPPRSRVIESVYVMSFCCTMRSTLYSPQVFCGRRAAHTGARRIVARGLGAVLDGVAWLSEHLVPKRASIAVSSLVSVACRQGGERHRDRTRPDADQVGHTFFSLAERGWRKRLATPTRSWPQEQVSIAWRRRLGCRRRSRLDVLRDLESLLARAESDDG